MNGLTRRDVLRLAGIGGASLLVGCGDNEPPRDPGTTHGAIVLEPDSDSFLVAVWSSVAKTVAVEVQTGDAIAFANAAEIDDAQHAVIDVRGLEPATTYQVTLVADNGVRMGPYRVRTAPRPEDPRPVSIAVSADLDPSPEFTSDLLEHVAAASPDLFVSLGDFPYTDNGPPAMTVEQYRERHVELLTSPRVRAWLQSSGVRAIYDDHEFRNDWDAMFRIAEASRYAAAMQVWDEFFPLRGAAVDEIRYRSWRWGAQVECFLLDARRFRSANAAPDDASKTMLGEYQRAWLIDGLTRSSAPFKLVFTSVPLDFGYGNDHWAAYTTERQLIFDAIAGVPGILFVSADQHWFGAHRHTRGIREFQVGPLARGVIAPPPETPPGVLFRSPRYNFGLIEIEGEQLTFTGIGADGERFYKETLTVADLTPAA